MPRSTSDRNEVLELDEIISLVKRELATAQNAAVSGPILELTKVTVEMNVTSTRSGDGKLKIGVPAWSVEAEGGSERELSSKLAVSLVPPAPTKKREVVNLEDFQIAQTIVDVRNQLQKGLDSEPHLEPQEFTLEIKFGVQRKFGGKGELNLLFLSIGGSGQRVNALANTVKLEFSKPKTS